MAAPASDLELLRVRLPHGPDAPGLARRAVELLADRLGHGLDDATLLVSELVTNAVRHGRPVAGGGVELEVTAGDAVRVAVRDGGGGGPPGVRLAGEAGGRGLRIVDAVAGRWGYRWGGGPTEAWFTMAPGSDPQGPAAAASALAELAGTQPRPADVLAALAAMSAADRVERWEIRRGEWRCTAAAAAYARGAGAAAAGLVPFVPPPGAPADGIVADVGEPGSAEGVVAALTLAEPAQAQVALRRATALLGADRAAPALPEAPLGELMFLARASHLLASSLDYDETLAQVARLFVPERADWVTVNVVEDDGAIRRVAVEHRDPEARPRLETMLDSHPHDPDADTGVPRVIRTGEPVLFAEVSPEVLEETANDPEYYEITRDLRIESCVIVPLVARGRVLGTMSLASTDATRLRFGDVDLAVASDVGRRAGVAIANARRYRDRSHLAAALARTLLPDRLPDVGELELAVRYVPAQLPSEVGGDFYDVVEGSDGEWYLLVGDVQGKGPEAATLIGLARHTLRTAAMRSDPPAAALQTLNRALLVAPTDRACTAICVRLVTVRDRRIATVARAGHPAPFLLRVARAVRAVEPDGLLLGVRPAVDLEETTTTLMAGDALVLYTDGIYGRDDAGAEERLAATLGAAVGAGAEDLANAAVAVAGGSGYDDLTVLVARVR